MKYEFLEALRQNHAGIRLLRADTMPLVGSFLWGTFVESGQRLWDEESLVEAWQDHLFALNLAVPRPPKEYLRSWVEAGYLRQFYLREDDVPRYELTPHLDRTLHWLEELRPRSFVGTESRLKALFDLLRALVEGSETDKEKRIERLLKQQEEIREELERVLTGEIELLDSTQIKERFFQIEELSRALLRDFSEVEHNFRTLDRETRDTIVRLEGSRAEVLDAIFGAADVIRESEQGKSFAAFLEFLMSIERQEELDVLLRAVRELDAVRELGPDPFLTGVKGGLMEGSEKVMETQRRLSSQLRRFLEDQGRREHRRIGRMIHSLEQKFLDLRDRGDPAGFSSDLPSLAAELGIPSRPLHTPALAVKPVSSLDEASGEAVPLTALLANEFVDERELRSRVRRCLESVPEVTLGEVARQFPVRQGVAEIVGYMKLAASDRGTIDESKEEVITVTDDDGSRLVRLPEITFLR